ncbi:MAG: hypothetical protein ACREOI_07200 [bacterium]
MILPNTVDVKDKVVVSLEKQSDTQTLELLQQYGYTFRRPDEVVDFLLRHSSLLEILEKAPKQIQRHFGNGIISLVLEAVKDPETEDDEELILFIQTALPVDQALQKLDRLDDTWWLETGSRTQGNLGMNLEFV